MKKYFLFVVVGLLSGCATGYQKKGLTGGYIDTALGADRYLVRYEGNGFTQYSVVQEYAIRRAKEVCQENGYTDFAIENIGGNTTQSQVGNYKTKCFGNTCNTTAPQTVSRAAVEVVVKCSRNSASK